MIASSEHINKEKTMLKMPNTKPKKRNRSHGTSKCSQGPSRTFKSRSSSSSKYQNLLKYFKKSRRENSPNSDSSSGSGSDSLNSGPKNFEKFRSSSSGLGMEASSSSQRYDELSQSFDLLLNSQSRMGSMETTLERFGFKSSRPLDKNRSVEKGKKTAKRSTVLFTRTDHIRQSIIDAKAALIINQNKLSQLQKCTRTVKPKPDSKPSSYLLRSIYHRKARKWRVFSLPLNLLNNEQTLYVKTLNLPPSTSKIYCLLKDWSTIPGRDPTPTTSPSTSCSDTRSLSSSELTSKSSSSSFYYQSSHHSEETNSSKESSLKSIDSIYFTPTPPKEALTADLLGKNQESESWPFNSEEIKISSSLELISCTETTLTCTDDEYSQPLLDNYEDTIICNSQKSPIRSDDEAELIEYNNTAEDSGNYREGEATPDLFESEDYLIAKVLPTNNSVNTKKRKSTEDIVHDIDEDESQSQSQSILLFKKRKQDKPVVSNSKTQRNESRLPNLEVQEVQIVLNEDLSENISAASPQSDGSTQDLDIDSEDIIYGTQAVVSDSISSKKKGTNQDSSDEDIIYETQDILSDSVPSKSKPNSLLSFQNAATIDSNSSRILSRSEDSSRILSRSEDDEPAAVTALRGDEKSSGFIESIAAHGNNEYFRPMLSQCFDEMSTDELIVELKKYGITMQPIKRKKALDLLKYFFTRTHNGAYISDESDS